MAMSRPNTSRFLTGALNPGPRNRLRKPDHEALEELRKVESEKPTLNSRFPVDLPHWDTWTEDTAPPWWSLLPEPLGDGELEAVPERLEVWALVGRKTVRKSIHRVAPKTLFGLSWSEFPTEYQVEFARSETLRIAQRAAWDAILDGASRVEIRSYRRKAASSRFEPGISIHGLVGVLKSVTDSLIDGEPSVESLAADSG
jgi:hypothetical protein